MSPAKLLCFLVIALYAFQAKAQYVFRGAIESDEWNGTAYLSVIDDYRKISGVHIEQIINKDSIVANFFEFTGDNLDATNKLYRIHVDNCSTIEQGINHFNGHCENSREIVFIANTNDTISFPISVENQMFCSIESNNSNSTLLFQIDSLKEQMRYDYALYRSEANRKLNNKKWFRALQQFSKETEEPLAELYVYNFLSDRSSDLYTYYLKDIATNTYYDELLDRLKKKYPNATYTKQYEDELIADKFKVASVEKSLFSWKYLLYALLGLSIVLNIGLFYKLKKRKNKQKHQLKNKLTQQEQKILDLILAHKTNKEIATEIFVSISTVKTHINNLYKKLHIESREQLKALFKS